jgi:hypothetical protein
VVDAYTEVLGRLGRTERSVVLALHDGEAVDGHFRLGRALHHARKVDEREELSPLRPLEVVVQRGYVVLVQVLACLRLVEGAQRQLDREEVVVLRANGGLVFARGVPRRRYGACGCGYGCAASAFAAVGVGAVPLFGRRNTRFSCWASLITGATRPTRPPHRNCE